MTTPASPAPAATERKQLSFLLVVSKDTGPNEVETLLEEAQLNLGPLMPPGVVLSFKDSKTWYQEQFQTCGSWPGWVHETVFGRDYGTRRHHFDGFVCSCNPLGRANADILRLALDSRRVVFSMLPHQAVRVGQSVHTQDEDNWQGGWSLITAAFGD